MELIVPDDKLSLAIGKKGQNVRLASQLTGWKIDIHSETKVRELEEQAKRQMAGLPGLDQEHAETLFKLGWRSPSDLADATAEELGAVPGLGGQSAAEKIIKAAGELVAEEERRAREERERLAVEAKKSTDERLLSVKGVGPAALADLKKGGYITVEKLAREEDLERLATGTGLGARTAAKIRHWARVYLGELPPDAPEPEVEEPAAAAQPAEQPAQTQPQGVDAGWDLK
jgi:N utilization substance protein A